MFSSGRHLSNMQSLTRESWMAALHLPANTTLLQNSHCHQRLQLDGYHSNYTS